MAGAQDEIPLMDCYTVWSGQCSSLRRVDVSSVLEYLAKSTDFCASSTIFSLDSGLRAFAKLSLHVLSVKAELAFFFLDVLGLWLRGLLSSCGEEGLLSSGGGQASHHSDVSYFGAWAIGHGASAVAALRL